MSQVLIVDDEPAICWALEKALSERGHDVTTTANAEAALEWTESATPDAVIMDVRLPGMDGLTALELFRDRFADTPVIVITAFGDLDTAVRAINRGAFEYLTKPFDLDQAIRVVHRAVETEAETTVAETAPPSEQLLLGSSPAMQAVFRDVAIVAEQEVPVLVTGESGTGKELVSAAIHNYSRRKSGPFVPVCIPAMSETVIESELFGHAKGAFTGAGEQRRGILETAHEGTAFLDEIGDISPATQVKLLRVLETKSMVPVGGNDPRHADFRLIAATNRNLEAMVAKGRFREDLYYRLNVYRIEIPPLRERKEDIPLLAEHFMRRIDPQGDVSLSDAAIEELLRREWNGNVRELRNAVEHAVVKTRLGKIGSEALPPPKSPAAGTGQEQTLQNSVRQWVQSHLQQHQSTPADAAVCESFLNEAEPILFEEALKLTQGNRQEAAKILGIHRQTFREKLKRHGVE